MTGRTRPLRADAARNRARLVEAAAVEFGERGLDAPLEPVARRAGVSVGTLYAHFPTRDALVQAILPERLAAVEAVTAAALAAPDPWDGVVLLVEGLIGLQAEHRGLDDALARRYPLDPVLERACRLGLEHAGRVLRRARDAGQLRADFGPRDLGVLVQAMSQVVRSASGPAATRAWRRHLGFFLDGLRPGSPVRVIRGQGTGRASRRRTPYSSSVAPGMKRLPWW